MKYNQLTINSEKKLFFGTAKYPVKTPRGLLIGGGSVYAELNFTLPPMNINKNTFADIKKQYKQIVTDAIQRSIQLNSAGLVLEFETLLEMTLEPKYGIELVKVMNEVCEDFFHKNGFMSEIRLTPNDVRDYDRPPKMRTSPYLDTMMELFEVGAQNGGDLLSIESTGGKEIFDDALMMCDIKTVIFSLAVLGVRDMKYLWKKIIDIAHKTGRVPGGDTACGFGNTAMVLAEKGYIPKVFAAIVRIATVVRTLVAIEQGAQGPDKDCGYEGPFLKAITGTPISMEGKTAACAHFSPVGNVAAACCDLWSNESVQNIMLLSGMAPTAYLEQLEYDVRLFNQAIKQGEFMVLNLQKLLVDSDISYDPQAFILAPKSVIEISKEIVKGGTYLEAAVLGCIKGLDIIERAIASGELDIEKREKSWINKMRNEISEIPLNESNFVEMVLPQLDELKWLPAEYGL